MIKILLDIFIYSTNYQSVVSKESCVSYNLSIIAPYTGICIVTSDVMTGKAQSMNMTFCLIIVIPIIGQDKKREISRERVSRERNTGWGRDRVRGKRVWRDRASLGEVSRRHYAGNIGRAKLTHSVTNWRDHKDITFFYFSRFADDITEKELWYHFKKWGDVREIFIPKGRMIKGET